VGEFPISDDTKLTRGPIPWELSGVAGVDANDRFCARFSLSIVDEHWVHYRGGYHSQLHAVVDSLVLVHSRLGTISLWPLVD